MSYVVGYKNDLVGWRWLTTGGRYTSDIAEAHTWPDRSAAREEAMSDEKVFTVEEAQALSVLENL